jgi:hypothetical protein
MLHEVGSTQCILTATDESQIASADQSHWRQHLFTLIQLTNVRRSIYGMERYPFMIWWICLIDIDAMFSGAGNGDMISTLFETDLLPAPSYHLFPLGADGSSIIYGNELDTLLIILQLDSDVTILAARLAMLSQKFRETEEDAHLRQIKVYDLQERLRALWAAPAVMFMVQNSDRLPPRSRLLFEHAQTLYRACIIYSHTSMWATQRLDMSPDYDTEIAVAANQILQLTRRNLNRGNFDSRFLVFPVFMAGFASQDGVQKRTALELIQRMEEVSMGKNTRAVRRLLEAIYNQQNERFMTTGQSLDVDWRELMVKEDIVVVNFGL